MSYVPHPAWLAIFLAFTLVGLALMVVNNGWSLVNNAYVFHKRQAILDFVGMVLFVIGLGGLYAATIDTVTHADFRQTVGPNLQYAVADELKLSAKTDTLEEVRDQESLDWIDPEHALWIAVTIYHENDKRSTYVLNGDNTSFESPLLKDALRASIWYGTALGPSAPRILEPSVPDAKPASPGSIAAPPTDPGMKVVPAPAVVVPPDSSKTPPADTSSAKEPAKDADAKPAPAPSPPPADAAKKDADPKPAEKDEKKSDDKASEKKGEKKEDKKPEPSVLI